MSERRLFQAALQKKSRKKKLLGAVTVAVAKGTSAVAVIVAVFSKLDGTLTLKEEQEMGL